jgi:hypothetical protein
VIEKLHKASWPDAVDSDILRKADHVEPRASTDDIAKRALDALADLKRQVDALRAADAARARDDAIRKACVVQS